MHEQLRVRMRTTDAGPGGNWMPGQVRPVTEEEGAALVSAGAAEWDRATGEVGEAAPSADGDRATAEVVELQRAKDQLVECATRTTELATERDAAREDLARTTLQLERVTAEVVALRARLAPAETAQGGPARKRPQANA